MKSLYTLLEVSYAFNNQVCVNGPLYPIISTRRQGELRILIYRKIGLFQKQSMTHCRLKLNRPSICCPEDQHIKMY